MVFVYISEVKQTDATIYEFCMLKDCSCNLECLENLLWFDALYDKWNVNKEGGVFRPLYIWMDVDAGFFSFFLFFPMNAWKCGSNQRL